MREAASQGLFVGPKAPSYYKCVKAADEVHQRPPDFTKSRTFTLRLKLAL